jgi:HAD superfamily hydrolase (TIGR01549 family)
MSKNLGQSIKNSKVVFWDFDGTIKDSIEVKSQAFEELFLTCRPQALKKIREHHEKNGGISRFEKIPLYMSWSKVLITDKTTQEYFDKFSLLVKQSVIDSPWVPGFLEFIKKYGNHRKHILVSATPENEIEYILKKLHIRHYFYKVYGAPTLKNEAISKELDNLRVKPKDTVMLGDSNTDYEAAKENGVLFFLRCTGFNQDLQLICRGNTFKDFLNR